MLRRSNLRFYSESNKGRAGGTKLVVSHRAFNRETIQGVFLLAISLSAWRAKVWATIRGKTIEASAYNFTGLASALILPQDMASSGLAPESEPSNS